MKARSWVASSMAAPRDRARDTSAGSARRDLRILEGFHREKFRRSQRPGELDERLEREAAPRHRHRPRLDAAMAIDPFLQRHLLQQVVEGDGEGFLHHPVDADLPRPERQFLRGPVDVLVRAELVEIVVGDRLGFRGERAFDRVGRVAPHRIEPGRGVDLRRRRDLRLGVIAHPEHRRRRQDGAAHPEPGQDSPAVDVGRLVGGGGFGQLPIALALEQHYLALLEPKIVIRAMPGPPKLAHSGHCRKPAITGSQRNGCR